MFQLCIFIVIWDSYSSFPLARYQMWSLFRKGFCKYQVQVALHKLRQYNHCCYLKKRKTHTWVEINPQTLFQTDGYRKDPSTNDDHEVQLMSLHWYKWPCVDQTSTTRPLGFFYAYIFTFQIVWNGTKWIGNINK